MERRAVITGAGSGIGKATAELFAARGLAVSCWDIRRDAAEATAEAIRANGGTAEALQCDVADEDQVITAFHQVEKTWGGLDALFINAGIEGALKPLVDTSRVEFERVLAINLIGSFLVSKHGIPILKRSGGGSIVMTASVLAHVSTPDWGAYGVSKAGLRSLAQSLAVEHAADGIRVNAIAPDGVSTALMHRSLRSTGVGDDDATLYEDTLSTPAQVAEVVFFLAGPESALISGSSILLDRGLTARRPQ